MTNFIRSGIGCTVSLAVLMLITACGGGAISGDNPSPSTALTVSSTSPANNATGVAVNAAISATFSEDMDSTTLSPTTFILNNGATGTVAYNGRTATFTPSPALASSTEYTAIITTGVKSLDGHALATSYTWKFTTGTTVDTTAPTVTSTSPANGATGVSVNSAITVHFSEAMNASTLTSNFTLKNGATNVAGTVAYSGTTATFTPSPALASSTLYTATVTTGAKDTAGNALANNHAWSFTTAAGTPGIVAPAITTQPHSMSVVAGQKATFSVVATGTAPLSYQWRKGSNAISGATSSSYTTLPTSAADNGAQFSVVVSNSAGNATSNVATLTVNDVQPVVNGSRYLSGSILSPITPTVATRLKALFAQGQQNGLKANVFFKVGDSISAGPGDYLSQFAFPAYDAATMKDWDNAYNLGNYQSLQGAHDHFLAGRIGSDNPYERTSVAAKVSEEAIWALGLRGGQTDFPLGNEWQASQGAYSVIMFGTNSASPNGNSDALIYQMVVSTSFQMLNFCIANGTVPILTAPPPYPLNVDASGVSLKHTRMFSRLLRAVAQGRQVPFIDYYASLQDLPNYGLQMNDVHPNAMSYNRFAFLTAEGLQYGYNMRNLITLQSLDRMYRLLTLDEVAPDAETGGLSGTGSSADPFVIDGSDFSDYQSPASGTTEVYYTLTVTNGGNEWQFAAGAPSDYIYTNEIGMELRNGAGSVVASNTEGTLAQTLAAGTYKLKLSFPSRIREYVFAALATVASNR